MESRPAGPHRVSHQNKTEKNALSSIFTLFLYKHTLPLLQETLGPLASSQNPLGTGRIATTSPGQQTPWSRSQSTR